jgi:hypothetical protein
VEASVLRFIDELTEIGLDPRLEAGLVIYTVECVEGARGGDSLDTGVAIDELRQWPQAPPHWIHLPADVGFARTNSRPSPKSGWLMHSRQITGWGRDSHPALGWASHVRAVLGQATT